jgi:hypothetical protein
LSTLQAIFFGKNLLKRFGNTPVGCCHSINILNYTSAAPRPGPPWCKRSMANSPTKVRGAIEARHRADIGGVAATPMVIPGSGTTIMSF